MASSTEYRMGVDTELFHAAGPPPVTLFLLCGDRFQDARLFRSGALSVHIIRLVDAVSMASCTVADHQWMLSRDALVARLHQRVFLFELPGFFFYAVVLPTADHAASLADIFSRFSSYHDLLSTADDVDESAADNPWMRAHARIQSLLLTPPPPAAKQLLERAVRTSAVVKLLNRSLLAGALQPARHLTICTQLGTTSPASALPSKTVVSDVLDAIETSRTTAAPGEARVGWWSLNVEGVMMLLRVVQAIRNRPEAAAGGEEAA